MPSSSAPARAPVARERLVDTLMLARRKHPAGPNRLDDLCTRYGIDNSRRTKHGALLDAELLAEVYVELIGAPAGSAGSARERPRVGRMRAPRRHRGARTACAAGAAVVGRRAERASRRSSAASATRRSGSTMRRAARSDGLSLIAHRFYVVVGVGVACSACAAARRCW